MSAQPHQCISRAPVCSETCLAVRLHKVPEATVQNPLHQLCDGTSQRYDSSLPAGFPGVSRETIVPRLHSRGTMPRERDRLNVRSSGVRATFDKCARASLYTSSGPHAVA
ncbi:hypothetical protein XU18_2075 [Perkinsela sp. CCAP 1560/4]|nr:hypothetical protein XU18_2364 [Perkinsela sp. CCAP 1560/4]KNH07236.1 hypothetical protein XU18_2075 [Perkinsela sp. CCAP 1560/4]|eukprot:KNH06854.1 hypothetical protein XU18_2364 [Perkinsela sp. CCAP 1560/4]